MKDSEKEIIRHIRQGKRATISSIARNLKQPISTISDRIKRVEEKYVTKRSSILDFEKVGYFANHLVMIKANPLKKEILMSFLKDDVNVNSIFLTNSGYDMVTETVFENQLKAKEWMNCLKDKFGAEITTIPILKIEDKEKFVPL